MITSVYAHNLQITVRDSINIKEQEGHLTVTLRNNDASARWYNLKAYMSPFETYIEDPYIYLEPNTSKTTNVVIQPLEKTLTSVYQTIIEISSEDYFRKIPVKIIQESNLECLIDLEHYLNYDRLEEEYTLDLKITNNKNLKQEVYIEKLVDVNSNLILEISQKHSIAKKEALWLGYRFVVDTNKTDFLYVSYGCKDFPLRSQEIRLNILKEEPKQQTTNFGMVVLGSVKDIYNSVVFQIFLVVVLILLVLSFSTRYIKHMYRK